MAEENISLKEANKLIKKRFIGLVKKYGFTKANRTSQFYFRVCGDFIQYFVLRFSRSFPRIECYLAPVFLYVNGNSPYLLTDTFKIEKMLPSDHQKLFWEDIVITPSDEAQCYRVVQFETVWENNRYALEDFLIPYLTQLDFSKTMDLFLDISEKHKNELFCMRVGSDNFVNCAVAVGLLKKGHYQEGYEQLKAVRDYFANSAGRYISTDSNDIFLFIPQLNYIDDLINILERKPENWEDEISGRIAVTEQATLGMWGLTNITPP